MNEYYLSLVISRLTESDIRILQLVHEAEANLPHKAISKQILIEHAKLSEAIFRKCLTRLISNLFLEIVVGSKQHQLWITQYGLMALQRARAPMYAARSN